MKIYYRLTDRELVERSRTRHRRRRIYGLVCISLSPFVAVACIQASGWFDRRTGDMIGMFATPATTKPVMLPVETVIEMEQTQILSARTFSHASLAMGFQFGATFGVAVSLAANGVAVFFGSRKDRLLIEYADKLNIQ